MSKPEELKPSPNLEEKLIRFYQTVTPGPDFAGRLEAQLAAKARAQQESSSLSRRSIFSSLFHRPVLAGVVAVALILLAAVAIIGPQKVLAEVQRLFGYLPGYGFVESEQVRVLAAPVEVQRDGAVLRVTSVIAESRQTVVTFDVTGLSPRIFGAPSGDGKSPVLVFPDGTQWTNNEMEIKADSKGEMSVSVHYPPLPQDVDQVTLVMTYLPGLPAGYAPENWSIPLTLSLSGSLSPYMPPDASASDQGITVSVLQVAQNANELGLQVQYSWKNPTWKSLQGPAGMLKDENGRQIPLADISNVGSNSADFTTSAPGLFVSPYRYSLPAEAVKKYTLTFDQMWIEAQADASFTFDPGSSPQPGQTWDLSNTPGMEPVVAGVPLKILSAEYLGEVQTMFIQPPDGGKPTPVIAYRFSFLVQPQPTKGFSLQSLELMESGRSLGTGSEGSADGLRKLTIDLPEKPDSPLDLKITKAGLTVLGSWQIEWAPPQR